MIMFYFTRCILINALTSCLSQNICFILIDEYFNNKYLTDGYIQVELFIFIWHNYKKHLNNLYIYCVKKMRNTL